MRITIATGIFPPSVGGPATYAKLLCDELPKKGIDVSVLSYDSVRYLPKGISHLFFFLKLFKASKDSKIILAQDPISVGLPTLLFCKITGRKFFIRVAGDYAWEQSVQRFSVKESIDDFQYNSYGWRVNLLKKLQSFVVRKADKVITPSIYFKNLVEGWGVKGERIIHIYNGIKMGEYSFDKNNVRQELGIGLNSRVLISSGRLVPWKGFYELIEIFESLSLESDDLFMYILGDGPEKDRLKSLIIEKGLEKRVFLIGRVDREEMFKYLFASDIFILNTSFESFSFQVVEAMSIGLPVITTNIGNLNEVVNDQKEGLLIDPNDKVQIRSAIQKLLEDKDLSLRLGANAKVKSEYFNEENLINNLIQILK